MEHLNIVFLSPYQPPSLLAYLLTYPPACLFACLYTQMCVSEFISFITSEASDKCVHEKRKTINGDDILFAMTSLGFDG